MWGWRLTLPNELPFWELESRWTPKPSKSNCRRQNTLHWRILYIIGKLLKCRCLKWAHMTHLDIYNTSYGKKERPKVKLAIWLPTTKNQESTRLPCMMVACDTPLESFQRNLKLCFRPCPNRRSEHEVIAPQSCKSPNLGSFGTSLWESRDKKSFECSLCGELQSILYGGRWWLPPSLGHGESHSPKSPVACPTTKGAST
jgi:hypothetical protein